MLLEDEVLATKGSASKFNGVLNTILFKSFSCAV